MNGIIRQPTRLILTLAILCSCIGCDRATKIIATNALRDQPPRSFMANTVQLAYAQNPGGFLSLGANLPGSVRTGFFIASNSVMVLGLSCLLILKPNLPLALYVSLTLILAGGIGNLVDRVSNHGLVTDFITFGVGPIRTGVFNVADVAITLGAISICLVTLKREVDETGDRSRQSVVRE